MNSDALLIVDVQNDFLPGGALPVPNGNEVIPVANRLQRLFSLVVATQDWHPPDHKSFAANWPEHQVGEVVKLAGLEQILWPVHCVQNTPGAELAADLDKTRIERTIRKGTQPDIDSYSGFFDNGHRNDTGLHQYLQQHHVERLYVVGLATDYCVKFTVLDALELGYETYLIEDGCRGVDLQPGDVQQAVDHMKRAGAHVVASAAVAQSIAGTRS